MHYFAENIPRILSDIGERMLGSFILKKKSKWKAKLLVTFEDFKGFFFLDNHKLSMCTFPISTNDSFVLMLMKIHFIFNNFILKLNGGVSEL